MVSSLCLDIVWGSGRGREGIETYSCPPLLPHAARIYCPSLRLVMLPSLHFLLLLGRGVIRVQGTRTRSLGYDDYPASPHRNLEKGQSWHICVTCTIPISRFESRRLAFPSRTHLRLAAALEPNLFNQNGRGSTSSNRADAVPIRRRLRLSNRRLRYPSHHHLIQAKSRI